MSKPLTKELKTQLLAMYESACLSYYRKPCEETLQKAMDAEHECVDHKIRHHELTKIRFSAMHAVEEEVARNERKY